MLEEKLNELKGLISKIETDQDKFLRTGSKPASVRVRKSLQDIKQVSNEYRELVIVERKKRKEEN